MKKCNNKPKYLSFFFFYWCFTAPPAQWLCYMGGRGRDGKRGYIPQEWDTLVGDVLQGEGTKGMALPTHPLSVLLHAQLFTYLQFTYLLDMGPTFRVPSEGLWCVYYNSTQL